MSFPMREPESQRDRKLHAELDARILRLATEVRLLPLLTPDNALSERARLLALVERGGNPVPRWRRRPLGFDLAAAKERIEQARCLAGHLRSTRRAALAPLYQARLTELELELGIIGALGRARAVRKLACARFGSAHDLVEAGSGPARLSDFARAVLTHVPASPEEPVIPADAPSGSPSLVGLIRRLAMDAGLEIEVRVEPRLAAAAAAGDRLVLVAPRAFGPREAMRLAIHEVFGHLVAAANGRAQPARLLEAATAGSFEDQEGLAIYLEEISETLDGSRLRTLAARVLVAELVEGGASFGDAVDLLHREHGFDAPSAVVLAERAFRGGGVARDVIYLGGYLRVRRAMHERAVTVDELRMGRVGLRDIPVLRQGMLDGTIRPAAFRPSCRPFSRGPRAALIDGLVTMAGRASL